MERLKYIVLWIFILSFLLVHETFAQRWKLRRYEVGFGIGTMQIFGDIGGTADEKNWFGLKDIKINETNLTYSGLVRYKFSPFFSMKTNFNYGSGQATDAESRNDRGRSFKTRLFECSATGEYYFLPEDRKYRSPAMYNRRGMLNNYNTFSGYAFLGVGVATTTSSHGEAVISPQDDYRTGRNISPVIPFGIGLKYVIDDRLLINADFGYRYAISDYIDGYKQVVSSKSNDIYYFLNVSLNYRLKTSRRNLPLFIDRKSRPYGR